jgi:hypothetical protein
VIEFLLLIFAFVALTKLFGRRENRRRRVLESAFYRASDARLSGIGPCGSLNSVYGERFFNPR